MILYNKNMKISFVLALIIFEQASSIRLQAESQTQFLKGLADAAAGAVGAAANAVGGAAGGDDHAAEQPGGNVNSVNLIDNAKTMINSQPADPF